MNELLPIIEELANCKTDAERALWLLQCPRGILFKYEFTIRNRLYNAFFPQGIAYIEAEMSLHQAVRQSNGEHRPTTLAMLAAARDQLLADAGLPLEDQV